MNTYVKAALAVAMSACSMSMAIAQENVIHVGLNGDIRSTDPGVNRDDNTDAVMMHIVEGLVAFGEDTRIAPLLASAVDISPDGLRYTFTLRDGVRFQNGEVLTADDVLWTWQRYLDPKTQWRCLAEFDGRGAAKVVEVLAPDPKTVEFRLDQANGLFLAAMARTDCAGSGILHPDSLGADGSWRAPIGTGPFTLGTWQKGQYVELERFDGYTPRAEAEVDGYTGNKQAFVDKVRFEVIPDSASAKAALLSGGVDVLPDVTAMDAAQLKQVKNLQVQVSPIMTISGLLFQTRDPLLKDVRIRRAVALSLDYAQMVAALSDGLSQVNNSVIPTASPYYDATAHKGYAYDLDQARRLLKEAGYTGEKIRMLVNKRYPQMFDMGLLSQAMAQAAGLNIEMETLEWGTQLERYQSGSYQMMSFSYSGRFDAAQSYESVIGDKQKEPRKVWDSPQALALLREAQREVDPARRRPLFDQLHTLMLEEVPMVVIYNGTAIGAMGKRVEGYRSWPVAKPRLWGVKLADTSK
ncbi:ABC transporter substrate-binding protein [Pseudomonas lundensis]|uniref:ABC transporter substrate-binding protein n=1 Tax=Pseudomonas lundensis TaxID=86185 RepID=UPI001474279D|nr:ABC transporter substrate-binding protein [Pseudomonas lundensis]MCT8951620.1 ABC transporter substrate-binding protein [Pseudomonas lundensis]NNA34852.1 ABC transporter substrate-binding protein [Pseudomonas lundensis]